VNSPDAPRALRPPRAAAWILAALLPRANREYALGDLEEEFHRRVAGRFGLRGARAWYWRQVWRCAFRVEPSRHVRQAGRPVRGSAMETMRQELRYASRTLAKTPGFTLVALLTLALGIGANTALFSVVHAVPLRALPFEDPARLYWVWNEAHLARPVPR
jgi:hypothetical protein